MSIEIMRVTTDVLVIGGGFAALSAALSANKAGAAVTIASKSPLVRGTASNMATGYAVALDHAGLGDNPEVHASDTLSSSLGLADCSLIDAVTSESPTCFRELVAIGVKFQRTDNRFVQYAAAGHSFPRSCVVMNSMRPGIADALMSQVGSRIQELGSVVMIELCVSNGSLCGALFAARNVERLIFVEAGATILATGGNARLFDVTSNPEGLYGEGCWLAYQAGATLIDMEFVQFQPYRVIGPGDLDGLYLASSTFEYGATLLNADGSDIMTKIATAKTPRTRDVVARAIFQEVLTGKDVAGGVVLDLSRASMHMIFALNPRLSKLATAGKFNPKTEPLIIAPQAHFLMGGVQINSQGETNIPGLLAAGEVSGGLHGANRLQDNALPETFVMGRRAGERGAKYATRRSGCLKRQTEKQLIERWLGRVSPEHGECGAVTGERQRIRKLMWKDVGVVRTKSKLDDAIAELTRTLVTLQAAKARSIAELANLAETEHAVGTGWLVANAAARRAESRGAHFVLDYPQPDAHFERPLPINIAAFGAP